LRVEGKGKGKAKVKMWSRAVGRGGLVGVHSSCTSMATGAMSLWARGASGRAGAGGGASAAGGTSAAAAAAEKKGQEGRPRQRRGSDAGRRTSASSVFQPLSLAWSSAGGARGPPAWAGRAVHGEDVPVKTRGQRRRPSWKGGGMRTRFQGACRFGLSGRVRKMVAVRGGAWVDVNRATGKSGWRPLHHALEGGHTGVVKALLGTHAVDVNLLDRREKETALAVGARRGHVDAVRLLLEHVPRNGLEGVKPN